MKTLIIPRLGLMFCSIMGLVNGCFEIVLGTSYLIWVQLKTINKPRLGVTVLFNLGWKMGLVNGCLEAVLGTSYFIGVQLKTLNKPRLGVTVLINYVWRMALVNGYFEKQF